MFLLEPEIAIQVDNKFIVSAWKLINKITRLEFTMNERNPWYVPSHK